MLLINRTDGTNLTSTIEPILDLMNNKPRIMWITLLPARKRYELGSKTTRLQGLHLPFHHQLTGFHIPSHVNKSYPTYQHNCSLTNQKYRYLGHHVLPDILLSHRSLLASSYRYMYVHSTNLKVKVGLKLAALVVRAKYYYLVLLINKSALFSISRTLLK